MVNLRLVSFRRKGARIAEAGAMLNGGESILSIGGEVRRKKMTMLEIVNMTKSVDLLSRVYVSALKMETTILIKW